MKEQANLETRYNKRIMNLQQELLVHKRMRITMDNLVVIQLLQKQGLTFHSCPPCLAKLLPCHHMRPIQKDPRVTAGDADSDDDEGPDVLLLHPDVEDTFFEGVPEEEEGANMF